jgi:hypothetical protein
VGGPSSKAEMIRLYVEEGGKSLGCLSRPSIAIWIPSQSRGVSPIWLFIRSK